MLASYRPVFERLFIVDEAVVLRAIALREAASARLPTIDALIAATAAHHSATLVHRDPHFLAIGEEGVRQLLLVG
jgi:predicted nucleic acid-binding protein